jgi:hypothetical protein
MRKWEEEEAVEASGGEVGEQRYGRRRWGRR